MAQVTLASSARRRVEGYVGAANGNDQPLSLTVTNSGCTLIAFASSSVTAMTFNGAALTKIDETTAGSNVQSAWGLINPAVGTFNLVVTRSSGDTDVLLDASLWNNTNQTTLYASTAKATAGFWGSGQTTACTIPTQGVAVSGFVGLDDSPPGGNTVTAMSGQTLLGQQDAVQHLATSYKVASGATSLGYDWTTGSTSQSASQLIVVVGPIAVAATNLTASDLSGGSAIPATNVTYTAPQAGVANLAASSMSAGSTISTGAVSYVPPSIKLISDAFTAWGDPTPLAGLTVPHSSVSALDGTFLFHVAGAVTDGLGRLTFINNGLVAGADYALSNWDATGANRGCKIYRAV